MRMHGVAGLALLGALVLVVAPGAARAQDEKVKVQVEVVLASNKGTAVEPAELSKMKETFQKQNFSFTSFKRLSQEVLEVGTDKATEVKLPNGVNASLKLLAMKGGIATVRVDIPRQSSLDVELGRQGSVYQKAGRHVGGELILVLSPPPK
ncbi:hypothetical protein DRW03_25035 [Corallococcus sp. H22C18031201]|uniref:hypothetical protein n=1 Tax=Citreicoccus inhibens TaxID=2849499 RepID=UPI000E70D52B|nr:hypothetical protein [Citreicoccus inhibens]MBU8899681.1 hypothetical protein [Citreicoccus inhibens]RJS18394.1 hypothetical protein DRW03_25035 [Corallococcus sp. H22C18031201]